MDRETITFTDEQNELDLKTVKVEGVPVEIGGEIVHGDCWFWFISLADQDSWYAFAVSDEPEGPDEMLGMSKATIDELRHMSVWLGTPWFQIASGCPHCIAGSQREARNTMNPMEFKDVMETTNLDQLRELRSAGIWRAAQQRMGQNGMKLSMN